VNIEFKAVLICFFPCWGLNAVDISEGVAAPAVTIVSVEFAATVVVVDTAGTRWRFVDQVSADIT
jgi:hypothetical protein